MQIRAKRIYDKQEKADGFRVLVDRLWPRGVAKADAGVDVWAKDIAPSAALRTWFHADPENRFAEFSKRYVTELGRSERFPAFRRTVRQKKSVTLLSAAKDLRHSHVAVLLKNI